MNGKKARQARKIADHIRWQHKQDVEALISEWPWYKRAASWIFPKAGERWADREIERARKIDEYAQRRTYKWIKHNA